MRKRQASVVFVLITLTLILALVVAVLGMLLFGLATQGWMRYAVTALYCLGLGLLNPALQALMSRAIAANQQGLLQGRSPA